jgi:ribosomal protein L39E
MRDSPWFVTHKTMLAKSRVAFLRCAPGAIGVSVWMAVNAASAPAENPLRRHWLARRKNTNFLRRARQLRSLLRPDQSGLFCYSRIRDCKRPSARRLLQQPTWEGPWPCSFRLWWE